MALRLWGPLRRLLLCGLLTAASTTWAGLPNPLIVTNASSWEPFSYIDNEGQARGLLIDIWRRIGAMNDVEVQFLLVDWEDSLRAVRDGRAHVHAGLIQSAEREQLFDFSTSMFVVTGRLFVNPTLSVSSLAELADLPVGAIVGGYEEEFLRRNYPGMPIRPYVNSRGMMKAAVDGRVSAFIDESISAMFYLAKEDAVGRFVPVQAVYAESIRAAVRRGDAMLLREINDAIGRLGVEEIEALRMRWMQPGAPSGATAWSRMALPGIAVVLLVLLVWILILQARLRSKSRELAQAVLELERANHRVGELASSDALTGLANRRHFHEIAWQELARARRYNNSLALVLLDVDHAREINDRHGQEVGDKALVHLAKFLARHLRETDLLARHAGEEFTLLLPGTDRQGAHLLVERMLAEARLHPLQHADQEIPVLFSAGIAVFESSENDLDALLGRADEAMQRAKESGRAQVLS